MENDGIAGARRGVVQEDPPAAGCACRRSPGVTIVGCLLIVSSLIHMHKLVIDVQWYVDTYRYWPPWLIVLRYGFSWLQRIIGILAGIGILGLKDIARKTAIAIGWFTILTIYWKHPYAAFKLHTQYLDEQYGHIFVSGGFPRIKFSSLVLPAVVVHCAGDIIFWGIVIYFLTRPSVKHQFRLNV